MMVTGVIVLFTIFLFQKSHDELKNDLDKFG